MQWVALGYTQWVKDGPVKGNYGNECCVVKKRGSPVVRYQMVNLLFYR